MFDARLRPLIDPPLNAVGRAIAARGVSANQLTLTGLVFGLGAAVAIGCGAFGWGLILIVINRLLDGLDGAVARASGPTGFGGYLDIVADFAFYVSVPVGFGFATSENLPYALVLVASFVLTGISFLAFAAIAAQRGDDTSAHGRKSFFYSTGIAEGGETIVAFVSMCILPAAFPVIATGFAILCILTVIQRTWLAARSFR
ncbi:MAG: CDP-alcohol phosphatidyltransferase family protein [Sphingomonas bacterium]|nr:CDP-alcohol phosphatidyltransferase family protein [Sphingomonas bacterium]